jgi:hypothetical protein
MCGRVGCTRATHDYGKNVGFITRPVLANGIGEGGMFVASHMYGAGKVVVISAIFPFPCQNISIFGRAVPSASVRVADESRFEEPDEVGFVLVDI